jgi:DNA-binding SARP family transcriptional activator
MLAAAGYSLLAQRLQTSVSVVETPWAFHALGQFKVESNSAISTGAVRPLDQLVIMRLVEAGLGGLPVLTVWEDVWGDHLYSADALRQSMSRIRRATGLPMQLRQGHCRLIVPWHSVEYDVARFEAPLRSDVVAHDNAVAMLEQQLSLYGGLFLSHLHHESSWLVQRRNLLHQRWLLLREKLALLIEATDPQRSLQLYLAVFEADGCHEMAAAGAMRCAARLGNRPQAIALYQRACEQMLDQLGADPSPILEQLYREIN